MFLFSPEALILFTTPKYYESAWVASILSINIVLIGLTYIASIGTSIVKNTIHYSIGVLLAGVVTVIFNLILIPIWGKEGSAIATVAAQIIIPVYLFYKAQKLFYIPYEFWKVAVCLIAAVIIGTGVRLLEYPNWWAAVLVKATLLLFFIFCISFFIRDTLSALFINKAHLIGYRDKI
jgi:O-antigen/teichoic acid export membrane protein